jgi:spermidine/putrescine transport system substrate-binding protein
VKRNDIDRRNIDGGNSLTRRQMVMRGAELGALAVAGPAILSACGDSGGSSNAKELNVLTWQGYHNRPWLDEFTKKTGIKVKAANVSSPAEAYSKVKATPDQYDIVLVTSGFFDQFVKSDLLLPIDEGRLPNLKNISPEFPFRDATTVGGKNYGVLYQWGDQYLGWNEADIPGNLDLGLYLDDDGKPNDWNIFWDPQLKGKVSLFDDPVSALPVVPLALGFDDPYHLTDDQFDAVKKKLLELRPQITSLSNGANDQAAQFTTGQALVGYMLNTSVNDLAAEKGTKIGQQHKVKQGIPSWSDNTAITKAGGGKKRDAAYKFINEGLSLPWQKRLQLEYVGNVGLSYDTALKAGLTKAQLAKTLLPYSRDGNEFFQGLKFFQTVEDQQKRLDLWNEFKLGIS